MANSPNTGIPYVPEGTLDPAAGLNLSLDVIDALMQTAVIELGRNTPPVSPANGDLYIVGAGTGAWSGKDYWLARYVSEGSFWQFYEPGVSVYYLLNLDDGFLYAYGGSSGWQAMVGGGGGSLDVTGPNVGGDVSSVSEIRFVGDFSVVEDSSGVAEVSYTPGGGIGDFVETYGSCSEPGWAISNVQSGTFYSFNIIFTYDQDGGIANGAPIPSNANLYKSKQWFEAIAASSSNGKAKFGAYSSGNTHYRSMSGNVLGGGFKLKWDFALAGASLNGARCFFGLCATDLYLSASTDPSAAIDMIGIGKDAGDTNLQFMTNDGSGTASKVSFGISLASLHQHALRLSIDCQTGGASVVVTLLDIDTGTEYSHTFSSNMPSADVAIYSQLFACSAASGSQVELYFHKYVTQVLQ